MTKSIRKMKKILDQIMILCCMAASLFCFGSCSDDLDIQQEYPFTVEAMPVADKIVSGQTVEIRLEITEEGNFSGTLYTLRYFQPDGNGLLKLEDGTVLKPNDRYLLGEKKFRLYYTSKSTNEAQTIEKIRSYVKNHIPVACHAVGSGSRQHWFVAYELTGESGGTWATAGIKVLDPYNSNSGSTEGRRVTILEAMQTSHVTLGVDRIRIPN